MRFVWNRDHEGVVTVYAYNADGKGAPVVDIWLRPAIDRLGMTREEAKKMQEKIADQICKLCAKKPKNDVWSCPINFESCKDFCGSYGCGG